jgi:hypothetical protein
MRLNNCSIAASYGTARIFAGLGFGSCTASRSIISRPRRTGLCSGTHRGGAVSSTRQCSKSVPSRIVSDRIGHANFAADVQKSVHNGMKMTPEVAPLGYELTGCRLPSPRESQTRRSRSIARPGHRAAFHAISAVSPRFVHKSVHNIAADVGQIRINCVKVFRYPARFLTC